MYNYWTDKIAFKAKITKELLPLLASFLGATITDTTLGEVRDKTTKWLEDLNDAIFDCEIKIDVAKKLTADGVVEVVDAINVTPMDVM